MKKIFLPSAMLVTTLSLIACGGGGGGGSQTSTSPNPVGTINPGSASPPASDSGSVSASFIKGSAARYFLTGVGLQTIGNLTDYIQIADGAVTTLDNITLSGQTVVKDINGDASFALGRWTQGTVTKPTSSTVLEGTSNNAYHYALYNILAALPTTGAYNCDSGKFTAPTYIGGTDVAASAYSGAATGAATLSFSTEGAAISVTINALAGGQTGAVTGKTVLPSPLATAFTGNYLGNGSGMASTVSDGGGSRILVIASYSSTLANGAQYQGMAVFGCSL